MKGNGDFLLTVMAAPWIFIVIIRSDVSLNLSFLSEIGASWKSLVRPSFQSNRIVLPLIVDGVVIKEPVWRAEKINLSTSTDDQY